MFRSDTKTTNLFISYTKNPNILEVKRGLDIEESEKVGSFGRNNILQIVSVILFVVFMLVLYLRSADPGALEMSSKSADAKKMQKPKNLRAHTRKVSIHLQDFQRRVQTERDRAQLDNLRVAPAPTNREIVRDPTLEPGVDLSQENDTLLEDLRGSSVREREVNTPKEIIYGKVAEESSVENEQVLRGVKINDEQKQFIRGVLARFRADGMEPIINKNLIITGYRKIDSFTGDVMPKVYHLDQPSAPAAANSFGQ